MRPSVRRLASGLLAGAVPLLLAACGEPPPAAEEVRPVRVLVVAARPAALGAELAGEVRPRVESRIGFQVAGRISAREVEVGQRVARGQRLAALDPADLRLAAQAAREQLNAARVERDLQRADLARFEDLHRQGFISGAELERRRAQSDAAEARLRQAQAQAQASGNQAAHAILRAPAESVVSAVDAEVGQVVGAGQSVLRLALAGDREVAIAIPESRLAALRGIEDLRVSVWASAKELRGRLREVAPVADAATRTYAARVTLLDAPPEVALGMTATVRFVAPPSPPVLAVPLSALLREADATYVWRLDRQSMTVHKVPVEVAGIDGNSVVLGSGVRDGDTLVTAGVHLLKPGQKVRLPAAAPGAEPAKG